jgi:ATP-dependent RNA helicase RhlB
VFDVCLDSTEILFLDVADSLLDMGFIPQGRRIVRLTPHPDNRQTMFFSATFTLEVMELARQWTVDPTTVEIEPNNIATQTFHL